MTMTARQAIRVVRFGEGWWWTLVDDQGAAAASGAAEEQLAAMEAAWRTARRLSPGPLTAFPEIIVEQPSAARARRPAVTASGAPSPRPC